jgi:hypothetical protein
MFRSLGEGAVVTGRSLFNRSKVENFGCILSFSLKGLFSNGVVVGYRSRELALRPIASAEVLMIS